MKLDNKSIVVLNFASGLFIASIVFLPSLFLNYGSASSMQLGTMVSIIFGFFIFYLYKISFSITLSLLIKIISILTLIFSFGMLSFINNMEAFNLYKFYLSFFYLVIFIISAIFFSKFIMNINPIFFNKIINIIFLFLILDGFFSTIKYLIIGNSRSLFFFSEPSHFALTYLPFLLYKCLTFKRTNLILISLSISLFIALFLQNLTLLIGLLLILFVIASKKAFFIVLVFTIIISSFFYSELSYFTSRIDFSASNQNLSTLVFLSGWERAYLNFITSTGFGIGFQQLGYVGPYGDYMKTIYGLIFTYVNFNDGGTTGSKLVSELGLFGLLFLMHYLKNAIIYIGRIKDAKLQRNNKDLFFYSVYIMIIIEFLIRGTGYFTATVFLFLSAIFYFSSRIPSCRC